MSNLSGLKVLDLGTALAAPFSAMLLGDMGAEVIKIEKPGRGDLIRATDDYVGQGESGYFLGINRGKEGLTVDIRKAAGQEIVRALVADCDILLENFRAHRISAPSTRASFIARFLHSAAPRALRRSAVTTLSARLIRACWM